MTAAPLGSYIGGTSPGSQYLVIAENGGVALGIKAAQDSHFEIRVRAQRVEATDAPVDIDPTDAYPTLPLRRKSETHGSFCIVQIPASALVVMVAMRGAEFVAECLSAAVAERLDAAIEVIEDRLAIHDLVKALREQLLVVLQGYVVPAQDEERAEGVTFTSQDVLGLLKTGPLQ